MDATEAPPRPQPLGLPPQLPLGGPQTAASLTQALHQHHQALQLNSLIANSQQHYHQQTATSNANTTTQQQTQQQHQEHHHHPLIPTHPSTNRHPASDCMALAAALAASASFPHIHQQLHHHLVQHQQQQQQQTPITRPLQPQSTIGTNNGSSNVATPGQANTNTSSTGSCNLQQQASPLSTATSTSTNTPMNNQVPQTQLNSSAQYFLNPAARVQPPPPSTVPTLNTTNNNCNTNNNNSNSITSSMNQVAAQPSQVPLLNFNRCPAAAAVAQQISANLSAPLAPPPPTQAPIVAHPNQFVTDNGNRVNSSSYQHPVSNNNTTTQPQQLNNSNAGSNISGHRPLASNTTLNSVANQNQAPHRPQPPTMQQLQQQAPSQQQQPTLGPLPGLPNLINDDLSTLFADHLRTILLNQLYANPRLAVPPPPVAQPVPQQQAAPAPLGQSNRSNVPVSVVPQQQQHNARVSTQPPVRPAPVAAAQPPQTTVPQNMSAAPNMDQVSCQQATTRMSGNNNNPNNATTAQNRMSSNQVPTVESYPLSTSNNNGNNMYQHQQNVSRQQNPTNSAPIMNPVQQPVNQQQQATTTQPPPLVPPPTSSFPMYPIPQMEQALALVFNPQVAQNLLNHVFSIYWQQSGLRQDLAHHHYPPPHFHHHLHNSHHHHHHHHGANGQPNGQDGSMPLDSLAISESKPRGLTRVEIDSLTPYIQMNDKDSRTCVICLSKFELKSKIRPLPCNHAFHAKCVDKWLRANRTCPICRRDALKSVGKIKRI